MASSSFYSGSSQDATNVNAVEDSKNAAALSEAAAAASAAASATSASSGSASAATATTKASESAVSATNSATSASASQVSRVASEAAKVASEAARDAASASSTSASSSAASSSSSSASAASSESAASTSAAAALSSKNAAAASEAALSSSQAAAAASASAASTDAASALSSKNAAAVSEANAATSEANAAISAAASSTASSSATAASNSATAASASATNSANSATAALASQNASAASATSAADSAASAAAAFDSFDDKYLGSKSGYSSSGTGPTTDNDGNALVEGALFFSSDANEMRVYDGANWIAASSAGSASLTLYEFTATNGQTTFSGSDDNSATLGYTSGNFQVVLNGVILDPSDYTATNGTSVVLASGAATGDLLNIYAFKSFTVADTVSASAGGTFAGNVTFNGSFTSLGIDDNATSTAITLDSSGNVGIGTSSPTATLDVRRGDTDGKIAEFHQSTGYGFQLSSSQSVATITAGYNQAFTFETGTTATERLRITSAGSVGIGTSSPGSYWANADDLVVATSGNTGISVVSGTSSLGYLIFADSTAGGDNTRGGLGYDHSTNNMLFRVNNDTKMTIDSIGNLLVGKTAASGSTQGVELRTDGRLLAVSTSDFAGYFNRKSTDGEIVRFVKDTTTVGSIKSRGGNGLVIDSQNNYALGLSYNGSVVTYLSNNLFYPAVDNFVDIGSSGNRFKDAYLSGGIYLGGTGAANKLDDYEEGTWSPGTSSGTISAINAKYTKIGRSVTVSALIYNISDQSSSNVFTITNLPFSSCASCRQVGSIMMRYQSNTSLTAAYITQNTTNVEFYGVHAGGWDVAVHSDWNNINSEVYFTITYNAD